MITKTASTLQCPSGWQAELANAIREPAQLLEQLQLSRSLLDAATRAAQSFPLRVPQSFVARMRPGDPDDPLDVQQSHVPAQVGRPKCGRVSSRSAADDQYLAFLCEFSHYHGSLAFHNA